MEMESIKKSRSTVRTMIRLSVVLLALVMMVISMAYAWFFHDRGEGATTPGIDMGVEEVQGLLLSTGDDATGTKELKLTYAEGFTLKAVAGDGENFYAPERELQRVETGENFDTYDYVNVGYTQMSDTEIADSVYSFDFSLMFDNDCELMLSEGSQAVAGESDPPKVSPYDGVDTGAIVGAVRLAFFQEIDGNYELLAIWIPDITTELKESDGVYSINTENPSLEKTVTVVSDGVERLINIGVDPEGQDAASGSVKAGDVTYIWGPVTDPVTLGQLAGVDSVNNFRLVVWIDGNDRECENPLLEGVVSLKINFAVGDISEATE